MRYLLGLIATLVCFTAVVVSAQTVRTYDQITAGIPDNVEQLVKPLDVRAIPDSIISAPVGSVRLSQDATIQIDAANTWYDVADSQVLCPFARGVALDANGRICNDTAYTWLFSVRAYMSLRTTAANRAISMVISRWNEDDPTRRVNFETCSAMVQWIGTQENFQTMAAEAYKPLAPGECFYIRVQCIGCTNNIIARRATLMIQGHPFAFVED